MSRLREQPTDGGGDDEADAQGELASAALGISIFQCLVNTCEPHDYSTYEDLIEDGRICGSSLKCAKCGVLAINEDMWRF